MGSGDWNDGMNLVGEHGKGESVWLGFFLYDVLTQFAEVARNAETTLPSPNAAGARRLECARISSRTAGTASGTAAPTSTTAHRSGPRAIPNARSIRSRKAGLFSPAPAMPSARTHGHGGGG